MWSQRRVVDDGLAKQAVVHPVRVHPRRARLGRAGRTPPSDVGDAQPYLLRSGRLCPGCGRENVTDVTYEYGDAPGRHAGQAKVASEPVEMAHDYDEFRVCVVEVCQGCSWNHLTVSFVLGNGPPELVGHA